MDIEIIFKNKDRILNINDVAKEAGVHPQTLRNWEDDGLLKPQRISGDQRIYVAKDLERIEKIIHFKKLKFNNKAILYIIDTQN